MRSFLSLVVMLHKCKTEKLSLDNRPVVDPLPRKQRKATRSGAAPSNRARHAACLENTRT